MSTLHYRIDDHPLFVAEKILYLFLKSFSYVRPETKMASFALLPYPNCWGKSCLLAIWYQQLLARKSSRSLMYVWIDDRVIPGTICTPKTNTVGMFLGKKIIYSPVAASLLLSDCAFSLEYHDDMFVDHQYRATHLFYSAFCDLSVRPYLINAVDIDKVADVFVQCSCDDVSIVFLDSYLVSDDGEFFRVSSQEPSSLGGIDLFLDCSSKSSLEITVGAKERLYGSDKEILYPLFSHKDPLSQTMFWS